MAMTTIIQMAEKP